MDFEGGGKARFVVRDHTDRDIKVYDISKLSLGQIRQVVEQLGFISSSPPLSPQDIAQLEQKNAQGDETPAKKLKEDFGVDVDPDHTGLEFDL